VSNDSSRILCLCARTPGPSKGSPCHIGSGSLEFVAVDRGKGMLYSILRLRGGKSVNC